MRNDRTPPRSAVPTLVSAAAMALAMILPAGATAQTASYLDFDDFTAEIRALADGSDAVTVESIGTSREGRDVWLVTVGAPGGAPLDERPAVLVVGNLQGDHVAGSHLALEAIRSLTQGSGDADVQRVLEERTLYVVPRLNPDGAEAMFASVLAERRGNTRPSDDDNDGRTDEDGPEDLNDDGLITLMRVADPAGPYRLHPDDPRLMQQADRSQGQEGGWAVYYEGLDSDGDGFLNEDGPGGVDLDRNFQHAYPYWEPDAGPHMVSEPESRALIDFVVDHRNVAAILTFGASDNLVSPPDGRGELADASPSDLVSFAEAADDEVFDVGVFQAGSGFGRFFGGSGLRGAQPGRDNDPDSGRRPATTVNTGDLAYYEAISDAYREITGIEEVGVTREPEGAFFQYGYFQYGVPSFVTPGWGLEEAGDTPSGADAPSGTDGRVLAALEGAGVDAFVPWSEYQHPELGPVEIGGFRPFALLNPPAEQMAALGQAHGEFVVRLADMLPRVGIVDTEVEALGGGIFRVRAVIENSGYLPTSLEHGQVCRCVDAVSVQIQVPPEDLVTGDSKTATVDRLEGSRAREAFTWVVEGSPGQEVQITLLSQKGGRDTATVTLR